LTRKIRLFYLIGTLDVGGAEGQLVQLLKELDRDRFSATVCCLSSSAGPYADDVRRIGIEVHQIGFRTLRPFPHPQRVVRLFFQLVGLIRQERPDIVHGYLFWAYVLGAFAARIAGVPKVISSRRSLGNFKAKKPAYLLIERVSNALTSLVIANSGAVRDDAIRQERLPAKKMVVIYNGVDSVKFAAPTAATLDEELQIGGASPVVTVIANFIHYKGHHDFFDAWRLVVAARPSAAAILVGEGPDRKKWEHWVASQGLKSSVRFTGSRRDVAAILSVSDIVAHPSHEEGFSNAILEAMAAGRPVVATAVGGNVEAIEDRRTGLLVPPRDPQALAAAILTLAAQPDRARQMGEAAQTRVRRCFSVTGMVRNYEAVYERIFAGGTVKQTDIGECSEMRPTA